MRHETAVSPCLIIYIRSVELYDHVEIEGPRKTCSTNVVIAAHAYSVRTTMPSLCTKLKIFQILNLQRWA